MSGWRITADTGGTFTDCLLESPDGVIKRGKVLSSGRLRSSVTAIHENNTIYFEPFPLKGSDWMMDRPAWIGGHSAGRVTEAGTDHMVVESLPEDVEPGAVIEVDTGWEAPVLAMRLLFPGDASEKGNSLNFRLGTTKGTNALLENKGAATALFLSKGFEDLLIIRDQKRPDLFARKISRPPPLYHSVHGISGRISTAGKENEPLDTDEIKRAAQKAREGGAEVAAVCLLNSWQNGSHEEAVGEILRECGFSIICLSSVIRPLIKYLDRADTILVEATLTPVMDAYLDRVQNELGDNPPWVMTSAGGLVSRDRFNAVDSLVSGPAGGVLGAVEAGKRGGFNKIIGLDMGGTSTDVSRWKQQVELREQITVGQARLMTPAMPIETVAAGGGSICGFDGERLFVGPESAGADPGPSCYGSGGPLSLTDIHLLLGRVDPSGFSIPIRIEAAKTAIKAVADQAEEKDWLSLAEGFLTIATERMAQAIRQVSLREGEDPADYGLVAFGGAGGLHACRVAAELGMTKIVFPPDAGILSARGIHAAPREAVVEKQLLVDLEGKQDELADHFSRLEEAAWNQLKEDGVRQDDLEKSLPSVFLRIKGQESALQVIWKDNSGLAASFQERFKATFGYFPANASIEVVKLQLRLTERSEDLVTEVFDGSGDFPEPSGRIDGFHKGEPLCIPVFERSAMKPGNRAEGPAIIKDRFGTCFIEAGWIGVYGNQGSFRVTPLNTSSAKSGNGPKLENVQKTLVLNRLEGLVEEMGDQLKRTALSTNIRERLDFSCALLDAEGRLLVNAPHIPVHLGAMGLCVREVVQQLEPGPGDVIITNHPAFGGSHLPDVTLVRGLFDEGGKLLGYLANRAHHAEIGGKSPGSMPADASTLEEEGVILDPQWIVRKGKDQLASIENQLRTARFPSRAVRENRIDLEAQLASLHRGSELFRSLLEDYGITKVNDYFAELYRMGVDAVAGCLDAGSIEARKVVEKLDDGHSIAVSVSVEDNRLLVNFENTSKQHPGNLNATPAIVRSAVLYVLRLLVDTSMPLNEGLLDNVRIDLPRCFLNPDFPDDPSDCPAVVGGNVETSQRIVDALIQAFDLMAAGQGTMNNFLFGNDRFGYYETIGGGAGAQETSDGASGVHVHMTNTAITDAEIIEQRFPVQCREFSLRKNSGGNGKFNGGDGLVREIRFLEPVSVSILSQNRLKGPSGCHGGSDGHPGRQWVLRRSGVWQELDGIAQVDLDTGDAIRIETPGGGGWG